MQIRLPRPWSLGGSNDLGKCYKRCPYIIECPGSARQFAPLQTFPDVHRCLPLCIQFSLLKCPQTSLPPTSLSKFLLIIQEWKHFFFSVEGKMSKFVISINVILRNLYRGIWVAHLVKGLSLGFGSGRGLRVMRWSPSLDSLQQPWSQLTFLSPSLWLSSLCLCVHALSLKRNISFKKRNL